MAKALGMSDRMIRYYCSGSVVIPRTVEIAVRAICAEIPTKTVVKIRLATRKTFPTVWT